MSTWTSVLTSPSASPAVLAYPVIAAVVLATIASAAPPGIILEGGESMGCYRRQYTYKVVQTDSKGRTCWDNVSVMSCWGRCDSLEIADWRFPFKASLHRVCMHDTSELAVQQLRNCDNGAEPGTENYVYQDAITCICRACLASDKTCEGLKSKSPNGKEHPSPDEDIEAEVTIAEGNNAVVI